jgi:hypothetical protein
MVEGPNSPASTDPEDSWPIEDSNGHSIVEDASLDEQDVRGKPDDVESDDGASDEEEEISQGTADTVGLTELGSAGQLHFGPNKCLVRLATKVQGHAILCGHPKDGCKRPKHKQLQGNPDRSGEVGIYNATPNANGAVLDAIEDTLVTEEEMEQLHRENRRRLEALGGRAQKLTTEDTIGDRSPTQVRFDTNPEALNQPLPADMN